MSNLTQVAMHVPLPVSIPSAPECSTVEKPVEKQHFINHHVLFMFVIMSDKYNWKVRSNYTCEGTPCGLCYKKFNKDIAAKTPCGHVFHMSCIGKHVIDDCKIECPSCKCNIELFHKKNNLIFHAKFNKNEDCGYCLCPMKDSKCFEAECNCTYHMECLSHFYTANNVTHCISEKCNKREIIHVKRQMTDDCD